MFVIRWFQVISLGFLCSSCLSKEKEGPRESSIDFFTTQWILGSNSSRNMGCNIITPENEGCGFLYIWLLLKFVLENAQELINLVCTKLVARFDIHRPSSANRQLQLNPKPPIILEDVLCHTHFFTHFLFRTPSPIRILCLPFLPFGAFSLNTNDMTSLHGWDDILEPRLSPNLR